MGIGKKKFKFCPSCGAPGDQHFTHCPTLTGKSGVFMTSIPEEALQLPSAIRGGIQFPKGKSTTGNKMAEIGDLLDAQEAIAFDPDTVLPLTDRVSTTGNEIDPKGVDHPSHYNVDPSGVECIEIVRHRNFNVGNAIKYLWRAGLKDTAEGRAKQINDLEKSIWYTQDEIERLKKFDLEE